MIETNYQSITAIILSDGKATLFWHDNCSIAPLCCALPIL
jgi:hypothetical protein